VSVHENVHLAIIHRPAAGEEFGET
jgi:hypothetical protein